MKRNKKPNILFIMDDQHNARCLSCEGHPDVKTPNLDRLAEGGVRFTRAFAQSAICTPSRVSFFTGQYLSTHGVFGNSGWLPPETLSLAYYLKERAGYQTGAVGKLHLPRWETDGLDYKRVCDSADVNPGEKTDYQLYLEKHGLGRYYRDFKNHEHFMAYISPIPEKHCLERWTADRAIEFIENRDPEKPFFLWLSFERPHSPHSPPPEKIGLYNPEKIKLPEKRSDYFYGKVYRSRPGVENIWHIDHSGEETFRKALSYYYTLITLIDENIGRVIEKLEKEDLLDETIIIFTSDHGDFAGEHGAIGKNMPTYDCLYRIPFIWFWKGRFLAGKVDNRLVESVDLFPTLCELIGIPIPPQVQGESLAGALTTPAGGPFREAVFFETPFVKTVRTERYKLSFYFKERMDGELYDLIKDPEERNNLFHNPEMAKVREDLLQRLLSWQIKIQQPRVIMLGWEDYPDWRWIRYLLENKGVVKKDT